MIEVSQKAIFLVHGHEVGVRVLHQGPAGVHRVADGRREHPVARVQISRVQVRDALLAADEREHLGLAVR